MDVNKVQTNMVFMEARSINPTPPFCLCSAHHQPLIVTHPALTHTAADLNPPRRCPSRAFHSAFYKSTQ